MKKVVINSCYGGYGLSNDAVQLLEAKKGQPMTLEEAEDVPRDDPDLVAVVEELGPAAHGFLAHLRIVEIPDDVEWEIEEFDGVERVAEKHRTWA